MKKFLTAAATAAAIMTANAVGFAAANPFEDVPADHWAYDAVAQLAADGVIEGYGDGTYRGDQEITRYEMAQMVAGAMARTNVSAADRAMIDRLAAEFADELNSLGVRVASLEKKVDNVKWKGWIGYEYWRDSHAQPTNDNIGNTSDGSAYKWQKVQFQLNPVVTINEHWIGRARFKYYSDMNTAKNNTAADANEFRVDRVWVEGKYGKTKIQLGKIPYETRLDRGLVFGNRLTGGILTFGNQLQATIGAGRQARDPNRNRAHTVDNMQFLELTYHASDKLDLGAAYYHLKNDSAYKTGNGRFRKSWDTTDAFGSDDRNIWEVGMTYTFSPKWLMNLAYAKSNGDWETKYKQAYTVEVAYNGGRYPDMKQGNFGAFLAYRYLGRGAVVGPTYDEVYYNYNGSQKGWNVGAAYVFSKNIMGTVLYWRGKDIEAAGDTDMSTLYTTLQFFF